MRIQFGRCSTRTYYEPALKLLKENVQLFSDFVKAVSFEEAPKVSGAQSRPHPRYIDRTWFLQFYELFEQGKVAKIAFIFGSKE